MTFFRVEYGVYINYLREPSLYLCLFYGEPLHGKLVSIALAVHAFFCLVNAFIVGRIIQKRKIVSIQGGWFLAIVCAEIDLLISPFCEGLSLMILIPMIALFVTSNARVIVFDLH